MQKGQPYSLAYGKLKPRGQWASRAAGDFAAKYIQIGPNKNRSEIRAVMKF